MFNLFKKRKPLYCNSMEIIRVFEDDLEINCLIENLKFEYKGEKHKIGAACYIHDKIGDASYEELKQAGYKEINDGFYLDNQIYYSLKEFVQKANIDGVRFIDLGIIGITDSDECGDPRGIVRLAEAEIDYN